jgi:hypothetical protein
MSDALRLAARRRAIAFLGDDADEQIVRRLTFEFIEFVHFALMGDISDGPYVHWLRELPSEEQRRFAVVTCSRTFDLTTREGAAQVNEFRKFVTCPKCLAIATMEGVPPDARAERTQPCSSQG